MYSVWSLKTWCYTVMAKNIGTLAILSENATPKKTEEKSNLIQFHIELKNGLDKMIGTLSKL